MLATVISRSGTPSQSPILASAQHRPIVAEIFAQGGKQVPACTWSSHGAASPFATISARCRAAGHVSILRTRGCRRPVLSVPRPWLAGPRFNWPARAWYFAAGVAREAPRVSTAQSAGLRAYAFTPAGSAPRVDRLTAGKHTPCMLDGHAAAAACATAGGSQPADDGLTHAQAVHLVRPIRQPQRPHRAPEPCELRVLADACTRRRNECLGPSGCRGGSIPLW